MYMAVVTHSNSRHWTAADLQAIPDDRNRYEIIEGELLVTPSPSRDHQRLSKLFFRPLDSYVETHTIGEIIYAPADIVFADDTVVEPDLLAFALPPVKLPDRSDGAAGVLLVVEILSPSTARADRTIKRARYQHEGIPEYWIVDGDAHVVERWRPGDERPEIISEQLTWHPDAALPALEIDLPALFASASRSA